MNEQNQGEINIIFPPFLQKCLLERSSNNIKAGLIF
jgi:hypothetical protein